MLATGEACATVPGITVAEMHAAATDGVLFVKGIPSSRPWGGGGAATPLARAMTAANTMALTRRAIRPRRRLRIIRRDGTWLRLPAGRGGGQFPAYGERRDADGDQSADGEPVGVTWWVGDTVNGNHDRPAGGGTRRRPARC